MPKPHLTTLQRNALIECRQAGKLVRRRDGFATSRTAFGAHRFVTVWSLVERGLMSHSVIGGKGAPFNSRSEHIVELSTAGREAIR